MKTRIFGIVLLLLGAGLLFFSNYIATQVAEGKLSIKNGQEQVDTLNSAFSQTQYTKPFGKFFTGGAEKKIEAGQVEVDKYERIANTINTIGIICLICGAAILILGFARKK